MIIKGKLIKLKREAKEFDKGGKKDGLFITVAEVNLTDEQMEELMDCFKESGKKFTPSWLTDFEGYVNLFTKFELPTRFGKIEKDVESMVEDGDFDYLGAEVKVSIKCKEGAIYPISMVVLKNGEKPNAFKEFDGEDKEEDELPFAQPNKAKK